MKHIPLHSLVILVGPTASGKSALAHKRFPKHEILNPSLVGIDLVGNGSRFDLNSEIFREIYHRTRLKLSLGERVVIDAPNLKKKDRIGFANIGNSFGAPIFYIIPEQAEFDIQFDRSEKQILQGDGVAEVIDTRKEEFEVVQKLPTGNLYNTIKSRKFKGVTAIGDVHAMREALKSAINWATARSHFIIFLGDTIDYGPKPLECVGDIYDIVMAGRGALVYGNHERKIERWIEQDKQGNIRIRIGEGNQVTIDAIKKLSKWQRDIFENRFRALISTARTSYTIKNVLFVHGAAHPDMFDSEEIRFSDKQLMNLALFGEVDKDEPIRNNYPNRTYDWIETIPEDRIAIVGHDIRSTEKPLILKNQQGGEVVFLDTGSGKGGSLTSADIRFRPNKTLLKVDNFNRH